MTNVSRIIPTHNGQYQIIGLKDSEGMQASMNLYESNIQKVETGNIYTMTKVKKSVVKKDGEFQMRLHTTKYTNISIANTNDQSKFDNINIGNKSLKGTILGFSEMNMYSSCEKHWNKLDSENMCPKCEGVPPTIQEDFKLTCTCKTLKVTKFRDSFFLKDRLPDFLVRTFWNLQN